MEISVTTILEIVAALLGGGGIAALFLIPEKKASKRLDNAERLIAKYEPIMHRLEEEIADKDKQIKALIKRVNEQDAMITELKTKLHTMQVIADEDRVLRCEIIGCKKRKPAIDKTKLEELV